MYEWKKFGDMTVEEKKEIVCAFLDGRLVEYYLPDNGSVKKLFKTYVLEFFDHLYYRVKLEKPTVPWDFIDPEYNWFAFDEDGDGWFYENKPTIGENEWVMNAVVGMIQSNDMLSIKNECGWRDSLVGRNDE